MAARRWPAPGAEFARAADGERYARQLCLTGVDEIARLPGRGELGLVFAQAFEAEHEAAVLVEQADGGVAGRERVVGAAEGRQAKGHPFEAALLEEAGERYVDEVGYVLRLRPVTEHVEVAVPRIERGEDVREADDPVIGVAGDEDL